MSLRARLREQLGKRPDDVIARLNEEIAKDNRPGPVQQVHPQAPEQQPSKPSDDALSFLDLPETREGSDVDNALVEGYLTINEMKYRTLVLNRLFETLDLSRIGDLDDSEARTQLNSLAQTVMARENMPINAESRRKITQHVEDEILGFGPLDFLLRDPSISDILVNGSQCVYVERSGRLSRSPVVFENDAHLMRIIDRIVSRVGRRIDESVPMVDARLPDGSRVNVVIPPLALDGPSVSIRRFPSDPLKLKSLVEKNALSADMAKFLTWVVKVGKNIVISGGTGSGKTTALNALSAYIPNTERIITIEDAAELQLQQPHVLRLETRPANIEGRGQVTQRDLVKNALRMRPDRIVIGEVRGEEAVDMLQAMNTGHDGSLTTIHANTARDALGRIENMVAMGGYELPAKAVRTQIASAINIVVQVARLEDGSRRMLSISEVVGMEGDVITMADLFVFERRGVDENGKVLGGFTATGVVPTFMNELQRRGVEISLDLFDPDLSVRG